MSNYITFTDGSEERIELFSIYDKLDEEVIKVAGENDLYLVGGTAIEVWLKHLRIKGWRNRSDNDIDLITKYRSPKYEIFKNFLIENGLIGNFSGILDAYTLKRNGRITLKVDVSIDAREDTFKNNFKNTITGIRGIEKLKFQVMNPVYLFSSKFDRYSTLNHNSNSKDVKEKWERDKYDLIDILKIIDKLNLDDKLNEEINDKCKALQKSNKNSADYCWARFEELIEIYNKELK